MYSVEPRPIELAGRPATYAVLPFSRHGVIRAIKVSPFLNRVPEPVNSRESMRSNALAWTGNASIGMNGAMSPRFNGRDGPISNASPTVVSGHSLAIPNLPQVGFNRRIQPCRFLLMLAPLGTKSLHLFLKWFVVVFLLCCTDVATRR